MVEPQPADVQSAGAVVFRSGKRVLLVHRPRYDDWSFPKGKLDRGEHHCSAAVREVAEETGVGIRLGVPLASQRYSTGTRMKTVTYWTGRVVGDPDVSGYVANAEIDGVAWVEFDEALEQLTYDYDQDTLREASELGRKTHALVVLRHGQARSRKAWRGDDRLRPLVQPGRLQSQKLVPVLAAYGITRLVTSSSLRCLETLMPYSRASESKLRATDRLSEEDATDSSVRRVVAGLLESGRGAVLCTHRPVLPAVFDALGVADPKLENGGMLVAHLREGKVLATELHLVH